MFAITCRNISNEIWPTVQDGGLLLTLFVCGPLTSSLIHLLQGYMYVQKSIFIQDFSYVYDTKMDEQASQLTFILRTFSSAME